MGRLAACNAWVGTAGTVTHLHTDQADNLLCQAGVRDAQYEY
jgi:lysine-specific demethylase 8